MPALRQCSDCGQLSEAWTCTECKAKRNRARDIRRGTAAARGYDRAWRTLAKRVLKRDQFICHWCGELATTVDHVTAKADGGTDETTNLVASCKPCNDSRGGTTSQQRRTS